MELPFAKQAVVDQNKLARYLLSPVHAHGRHKWRVFASAGFTAENVQVLANALFGLARTSETVEEVPSPFGRKFVIVGEIGCPTGGRLALQTIWMLRAGKPPPYFVTAYPAKRV